MKINALLLFTILSFSYAFGQASVVNDLLFEGKVNFLEIDDVLGDITISVSQEGEELSKTTSSDGKYLLQVKVDLSKPFHIYFSHKNYLEKYVTFDLSNYAKDEVELPPVYSPVRTFDMDMLQLDYVDNLKSICVAKFSVVKGKVRPNQQFSDQQRKNIEEALRI